ncbi:MAG: SusE domain-containing protein [Lewinellaceae bacterium]|nr:SusE domain-containing protein [Lewinellaceae bacterium]
MKKYFLLSLFALLLLAGCKDDEFGPVLQVGNAPAFSSPANGTEFILTEDKASEVFADFESVESEYGFDAAVTYTLELG